MSTGVSRVFWNVARPVGRSDELFPQPPVQMSIQPATAISYSSSNGV